VRSRSPAANWFQSWRPTGRSIRTRTRTSRYLTRAPESCGGDCGGAELSDRTPSNLSLPEFRTPQLAFRCAGSRQDREFERASPNALFGRQRVVGASHLARREVAREALLEPHRLCRRSRPPDARPRSRAKAFHFANESTEPNANIRD
jgi:hypothetical protein